MPTSTGQSCRNVRLFGGYFYNSLTQGRPFGVRSGAGWQEIDNAYFDDPSAVPPYIECEWHASPRHAELFTKQVGLDYEHTRCAGDRATKAPALGSVGDATERTGVGNNDVEPPEFGDRA